MREIKSFILFILLMGAGMIDQVAWGADLIPLGDSITDGTLSYGPESLGYRQYLQDELGITAYTFKGQFASGPVFTSYQRAHSGVIGQTNREISARLPANLALYAQPDPQKHSVILIHAGTNDLVGSKIKTENQLDESVGILGDMITAIHQFNANIDIYVALLIPSRGVTRDTNISLYNAKVIPMVKSKGYANLYYVDMNAAFKNDTFGLCSGDWFHVCMADALHPSHKGYQVMGKQWAACIKSPIAKNCNGH